MGLGSVRLSSWKLMLGRELDADFVVSEFAVFPEFAAFPVVARLAPDLLDTVCLRFDF